MRILFDQGTPAPLRHDSGVHWMLSLFTATVVSHVVCFRGTAPRGAAFLTPSPSEDERVVLASFVDVLAVFEEGVVDGLLGVGGARTELGQAVNHVLHQMEAIHLVQ